MRWNTTPESAFFETQSSHLKPTPGKPVGLTTVFWRFGFNTRQGEGYEYNDNKRLFLVSSSGLTWTHTDFEWLSPIPAVESEQRSYDEKIKFGDALLVGAEIEIVKDLFLTAEYERTMVSSSYSPFKWAGTKAIDLLLLNAPDLYEPELRKLFGNFYAPVMIGYRTAVKALLFNNKRKLQAYYPFDSDPAMSLQSYRLGLKIDF